MVAVSGCLQVFGFPGGNCLRCWGGVEVGRARTPPPPARPGLLVQSSKASTNMLSITSKPRVCPEAPSANVVVFL